MHDAWWAAARRAHGEADGTRALIEVLLLHRHLRHEHVVAGLAAALQAGASTSDTVALERASRRHRQTHHHSLGARPADSSPVTSLTERRLRQLPPDTRPLPSSPPMTNC